MRGTVVFFRTSSMFLLLLVCLSKDLNQAYDYLAKPPHVHHEEDRRHTHDEIAREQRHLHHVAVDEAASTLYPMPPPTTIRRPPAAPHQLQLSTVRVDVLEKFDEQQDPSHSPAAAGEFKRGKHRAAGEGIDEEVDAAATKCTALGPLRT